MTETGKRFERAARWQRARRDLSWPEKIRMAERLRESVLRFKEKRRTETGSSGPAEEASRR